MYKLTIPLPPNTEPSCVLLVESNTYIPMNPDNTDYQAYLKWLEEGNTPEPAENT